jgi:hypothetical protein
MPLPSPFVDGDVHGRSGESEGAQFARPDVTIGGSLADLGAQQFHRQAVAVVIGHVHGGVPARIRKFRISPESQQNSGGLRGHRLAALQGAIALDVDCMRQQRHVAADLIGIGTVGQQAGQGLRALVLDRMMGGRPVGTHQGIQPPSHHIWRRTRSSAERGLSCRITYAPPAAHRPCTPSAVALAPPRSDASGCTPS